MTSHIHRGFHRIGVVLAAAASILVVWALVQGDKLAALILFATALALYVATRAIGWVLAGFMGSSKLS
jgi:hypothetical protein